MSVCVENGYWVMPTVKMGATGPFCSVRVDSFNNPSNSLNCAAAKGLVQHDTTRDAYVATIHLVILYVLSILSAPTHPYEALGVYDSQTVNCIRGTR